MSGSNRSAWVATIRASAARLATAWLLALTVQGAQAAEAAASNFEERAQVAASAPGNLAAGNELRRICRETQSVDRCIEFFDKLAKRHPEARATRYNAALAYVDKLPGLSLLAQARLSTNSMEHASAVLAGAPDDWLAHYIRGLNNLYWPLWYRRMERAIADLKHCTELSAALPTEQRRAYMALAYLALGDAHARLGQPSEAREIWSRGVGSHPTTALRERLALAPENIASVVEAIRSRDVPIDTDVSFYATDIDGDALLGSQHD